MGRDQRVWPRMAGGEYLRLRYKDPGPTDQIMQPTEASFIFAMYAAPVPLPLFLLLDCDLHDDLNAAFLLPRWHVASCCRDDVRNISKQKSLVGSPETGKGSAWPRHRRTFLSLRTIARRGR